MHNCDDTEHQGWRIRLPILELLAIMSAMVALGVAPAAAQEPTRELGIHALVLAREPAFVGGGGQAAIRTTQRTRFALAGSVGRLDGQVAGRVELTGQFLLSPFDTTGAGLYAGGGAGVEFSEDSRGVVIVLLGIEGTPGSASGWFAEAGLGGGARFSVGWRWRTLSPLRRRR